MSFDHDLPLMLYKANLEFYLKTGKLLQESGQQWLEIGTRAFGDGIAESNAEVDQLIRSGDWQTLAALPHDAYWRQFQQRFGDSQAITQIAISNQAQFFAGLQEALHTWQEESAAALGTAGHALPLNASFEDLFQQWDKALANTTPTAATKTAPKKPPAKTTKKTAKKVAKKVVKKAPAKAGKAPAKKTATAKKKATAAKRTRS